MKQRVHEAGYLLVAVKVDGKQRRFRVHRLVLEAFVGPCPDGKECCHRDGDPTNNSLGNLYWGTHGQNMNDQVRHGTHTLASANECKQGHEFTVENTIIRPAGGRDCRECNRRRSRESMRKRRALLRSSGAA